MAHAWGRPIWSYEYTPDELLKEAQEYFNHCDKEYIENSQGKLITYPKTLSGLRKWLRVGINYINQKAKEPSFSWIIQQIYDEIEEDVQLKASMWFTNPTIAVRNLSANFNWKDKIETENTNRNTVELTWELKHKSDEELTKALFSHLK